MIASMRQKLRQVEASAALRIALDAELPDFTGFHHVPLSRLKTLFASLGDHDKNLASLRELGTQTNVVLGLCLSTRKIKRMDPDDLAEFTKQAEAIGSRLQPFIYTSLEIARAIEASKNEGLIQIFNEEVGEFIASRTRTSYIVVWNTFSCYAHSVPHGLKYRGLTALAFQRVVTVYTPLDLNVDCGIRLTTLFDEDLLESLFGYRADYHTDGSVLHALRHQIAPRLGEDVLKAVEPTAMWSQGANPTMTECIRAVVYAGHTITIDVVVKREKGIAFVNDAGHARDSSSGDFALRS
ncbi:hypothetical protein BKA56DRAFT_574587 [Ilyonectria sp. MPI-CAGE-AT-0026]|nr:hypothetical protein BKA56DRAFT_574587 [Ilyonectria sp. MPI-CAGE-AT-0026]